MSETLQIADLSWLAGTWHGKVHDDVVEEIWGAPIGNTLAGVFRWLKGDGIYMYEILAVEPGQDGLVLELRHFGAGLLPWESESAGPMTWRAVSHGEREVVFENEHYLFPRRLVYRRTDDDVLVARLEGTREDKPADMEFRFERR